MRSPRAARLLAVTVAAVLAVGLSGPVSASTSQPDARRLAAIDTSSRDAVIASYRSRLLPAQAVPTGWTGSVAGCRAGAPSAAAQQATLEAINYLRALAGLGDVRLDPARSARAQEAALMMLANGQLDHDPPSTWRCYTAVGDDAAGMSNLYLGPISGADSVVGYAEDPGDNNESVGHRRWLLMPRATVMGSGQTSGSNALYVLDADESDGGDGSVAGPWVQWPVAGYFPQQLEPGGRWSLGREGVDFSAAQVTVRDLGTGRPLAVRQHAVEDGYGINTLAWQVDGIVPAGSADRAYEVTVSGMRDQDGAPLATYRSTTTLIDAAPARTVRSRLANITSPKVVGKARVGRRLTVNRGRWSAPPQRYAYRWYRDGKVVGKRRTYVLRPADRGHRMSVKVVAKRDGWTSGSATSSKTKKVKRRARA